MILPMICTDENSSCKREAVLYPDPSMLDSGSWLTLFILSSLWGFMESKSRLGQMGTIYTIHQNVWRGGAGRRGGGTAGRRGGGAAGRRGGGPAARFPHGDCGAVGAAAHSSHCTTRLAGRYPGQQHHCHAVKLALLHTALRTLAPGPSDRIR
jgi:hypothetical protein